MRPGDVMSIRFSPVNTWDWTCIRIDKGGRSVLLKSPGGNYEVHSLPKLTKWEAQGKVEIRRMD